jgi:L-asparaginase/Glu-tRNA(Gln) amidotransferase subunit D
MNQQYREEIESLMVAQYRAELTALTDEELQQHWQILKATAELTDEQWARIQGNSLTDEQWARLLQEAKATFTEEQWARIR